jgi:hypothetical protein
MEIRRIQGIDDRWDDLVWTSPWGTIFHTLKFLSYHPGSRFDFLNLAFFKGNDVVCVVPGARVSTGGGDIFRSPAGASFGGFVFRDDSDLRTMADALSMFGKHIRDLGFVGIEMSFPPLCYSRSRSQALPFLMISSGYSLASREATTVVPLRLVREEGLNPTIRRNVRKAKEAGVEVRRGENLRAFCDVLEKNLGAKGVAPTHSPEELEALFSLFPDNMILLEAVLDERVIGGCLLVICNPVSALAFYICDDPAARQFRIAEATLHACLELLVGSGVEYLDLGTVSIDGQLNWGLLRFKSKFSPRLDVRERYSLRFDGASQ